jgi:hypothetical protein
VRDEPDDNNGVVMDDDAFIPFGLLEEGIEKKL